MRPQVTVYLPAKTKKWLIDYAGNLGLHRTDVVRCLLERERQVGWLEWAMNIPDPARATSKALPTRGDGVPSYLVDLRRTKPVKSKKKRYTAG